jgi:hypothetical protein
MSYNRKAIADALSKMNKAKKPKQPKDIIKDPEGQYKYPGVPTRIASDNITMQGVPFPVLGVDNLGNQQMMQPGAEYVFPGADYVDEFPIAKYGGLVTGLTNTSGNLLMSEQGKRMMAQSGSLSATNKLLKKNPLFKKKNYKGKTYDPSAMYFQDGGFIPYDYNPYVSAEAPMEDIPFVNPIITGTEPEDYQAFLDYSRTAPENRRPNENYFYGDPDNYDHYGMWEALGKPRNFQEALDMNPDWEPDPYDKMYHGFSVNPETGVFLKSGKPGDTKEGDTTWMEIAGHYLSPRANESTPVFDPELQRFKYIPNPSFQKGGQMSKEEFEKRKAAYKKLTGRDFEPPKTFKPSEKARQQYQEKYNQQPTVQQQPSETVNQSRGTNNANIKQELDKSTREEIEERNRQRIEENRTYFEADTRSNAQRERDQFYANQLTDPNIYNQIGNFLDAGIAQVGNFWDYISGGDDWEKELENYKLQRLNPYVSDKDKLKEFVNFGLSNTGNALMTGMEIADGYALARAIPGIQSQVGRYLSKPSISNTPRQLPGSSNAALPPNTRPQLNIQQQRNAELLSEWVNNRGMTGQQLLNFSQRDPDWLRLVEDYVTVTGDRQGINAFLAGGNRRIPTYRSNILDTQPIQNIINTGSIDLRRNRLSAPVIFDPGTLFELATGKGVSLGSANRPTLRNLTTSLVKKPAQKLQNVLTNLDKKMGAFLEKNISTAKKPISITDIEKEVNLLLEKGVGVKKAKDVKIKLETVPGSSQAAIHIDIKDYFKNNKKLLQDAYPDSDIDAWIESVPDGWINSGTIHVPSTIKPTAQTRRFTEIVRGKPKEAGYLHSGPSSPIEVPGLRKKGEFPFTNWDTGLKDNILNNLGISGEYNKALNEVLKSKGYGLYSGGTGHLSDGAKRYVREFLKNRVNIVNPEQAKIFLDQLRDPEVMRLIDNALKNKNQALPPEVYSAMQNVIFKYKKKGGSIQPLDYFDTELTDQEIEQYKKGGCVVVKL